jgi:hypothetical protein
MGRPKPLDNTRQTNNKHLTSGGNCGALNTPRKAKRLDTCITSPSNIHVRVFPRKARGGGDGRRLSSNSLGGSKHPLQPKTKHPRQIAIRDVLLSSTAIAAKLKINEGSAGAKNPPASARPWNAEANRTTGFRFCSSASATDCRVASPTSQRL